MFKNHFPLIAVILLFVAAFVSCSKVDLIVPPAETAKTADAKESAVSKTVSVTAQGHIWVEGSLSANGGVKANLAETNVCISDIFVTFVKNGYIVAQERAVVAREILNPVGATEFSTLPLGLGHKRRALIDEAILLPAEEYDQIEVTVNYVVRTLNPQTGGFSRICPNMESFTYWSSRETGYDYHVYVPISLTSY